MPWPSKVVKNSPKSSNHRNTHTAIAQRVRTFEKTIKSLPWYRFKLYRRRLFLFVDVNAKVTREPSASNFISIGFYELHVYGLRIVGEIIQII